MEELPTGSGQCAVTGLGDGEADMSLNASMSEESVAGLPDDGESLLLLSLFCGAGGLDLGFEQSGFQVGLALDKRVDSVKSYRHNRPNGAKATAADVRDITLGQLDDLWGGTCAPTGLIGGPPCQSFSQANQNRFDSDPRHELPLTFAKILGCLNARRSVPFFVMENVTGLTEARNAKRLTTISGALRDAGFEITSVVLNAVMFGTPQRRRRLFLVGLNSDLFPGQTWVPPKPAQPDDKKLTVRAVIGHLPEPALYARGLSAHDFPAHPNHWAMMPKSRRFSTEGALAQGQSRHRSFKTLHWDRPSITVAYGNREVHVHPSLVRRLSVYEAMLLQGFPPDYVLLGSLSSQILQVSEAVPPPMAKAVADTLPLGDRPVNMASVGRSSGIMSHTATLGIESNCLKVQGDMFPDLTPMPT